MIDRMFNQEERASLSRDKRLALVDPGKSHQGTGRVQVGSFPSSVATGKFCEPIFGESSRQIGNSGKEKLTKLRGVCGYTKTGWSTRSKLEFRIQLRPWFSPLNFKSCLSNLGELN